MLRRCIRPASVVRGPGFVVAGGAGTMASLVVMAGGAVAGRRAGDIRDVRFLPRPPRVLYQRRVGGVVQPSMPLRRHPGRLCRTGIGHPTPHTMAGARSPLHEIRVAKGVGADAPALEPGEQPSAEVHAGRYTKLRGAGPPIGSSTVFCGLFAVRTQNTLPESRAYA